MKMLIAVCVVLVASGSAAFILWRKNHERSALALTLVAAVVALLARPIELAWDGLSGDSTSRPHSSPSVPPRAGGTASDRPSGLSWVAPSTPPETSPAGPVLFQDDFSTTKGGWPDNGGAASHGGYYASGAYRFQSREPGSIWGSSPQKAASVHPDAPSSIRVSAHARWSAPNDLAWFGLACRVRSDLDAYYLLVANGVAHIVKMKNGVPQFPELAVGSLRGVDLTAGVQLEADCATVGDAHATRLVLKVDGRPVLAATDARSPLESGTAGVAVEMNTQATGGAEAEFKDFTVARR
jgi:hypothetical protein